ncbi:MAG: T9SS type A sorting domain-containing protein [Bacteroidota bacterium]
MVGNNTLTSGGTGLATGALTFTAATTTTALLSTLTTTSGSSLAFLGTGSAAVILPPGITDLNNLTVSKIGATPSVSISPNVLSAYDLELAANLTVSAGSILSMGTSAVLTGTAPALNVAGTSTIDGVLDYGTTGFKAATLNGDLSGTGAVALGSRASTLSLKGTSNTLGAVSSGIPVGFTGVQISTPASTFNFTGVTAAASYFAIGDRVTVVNTAAATALTGSVSGPSILGQTFTVTLVSGTTVTVSGTTFGTTTTGTLVGGTYPFTAVTTGSGVFTITMATASTYFSAGDRIVITSTSATTSATTAFVNGQPLLGQTFTVVSSNATTVTISGTFTGATVSGTLRPAPTVSYDRTSAQDVMTTVPSGSVLSITGGATKTADGSIAMGFGTLNVASGTTLDLGSGSNAITSGGSFTGTGTITGTGTTGITLSGTNSAPIDFAPAVSAIGSFTVNKVVNTITTGINGKYVTINQDVNTSSLGLASGRLVTASGSKLILTSGASLPTPADTGAYVVGTMKYTHSGNTTVSGATITFPVGSSATLSQFTPLTVVGLKQSATTEYTVSSTGAPASNLSTVYAAPPIAVSASNYYTLIPSVPGNLTGVGAGLGSVKLRFVADANINAASNSVVSQLTGGAWTNRGSSVSTGNSPTTTTAVFTYLTSSATISGASSSYIFAIGSGSSTSIYVSTTGDDNNSGTSSLAAKKTINAGIAAVCQGCSLYVAAGNYPENVVISKDLILQGPTSGDATVNTITTGNAAQVLVTSTGSIVSSVINAPGHGFITGERVLYTAQSGSIGGLATSNDGSNTVGAYYVYVVDADNFKLATNFANAQNNFTVTLSSPTAGTLGVPAWGIAFAHSFTRAPLVSGNITATTVNVPANGHIGTGILLAKATGTVNVGEGHFFQRLAVAKGVTLKGVSKYGTVLDGNFGANSGGINGFTLGSGSNNFYLENFKIEEFNTGVTTAANISLNNVFFTNVSVSKSGANGWLLPQSSNMSLLSFDACNLDSNGVTGTSFRGFFYQGNAANSVTNFTFKNGTSSYNSLGGLDLNAGYTFENILIKNNILTNNGDAAISISLTATSSNVVVSDNTINLGWNDLTRAAANQVQRYGIEIKNPAANGTESGSGAAAVLRNTITQSSVSTSNSTDNAAIVVMRRNGTYDPSGAVVAYNLVTGIRGSTSSCSPGTIKSEGIGIFVAGSSNRVYKNIVTGCDVGVQTQAGNMGYTTLGPPTDIQSPSGQTVANNNCLLNGMATADYFDRDNTITTANNYIKFNSFSGNTLAFRNVNSGGTGAAIADVSGNWWNSSTGPLNATYNSAGAGQPIGNSATYTTARIAFSPWLKSDPDTDPDPNAVGVQTTAAAKSFIAGGTQSLQTGVTNLALAQDVVSSSVLDEVELASTYNSGSNIEYVSADAKFKLKGGNKDIGSLRLNNANAEITLTGPVGVSTNLRLDDGIIYTTSTNLLTLGAGATVDTGSALIATTRAGYIAGPVAAVNATTSARNMVFPFGVAGVGKRYARLGVQQGTVTSTTYTGNIVNESGVALPYNVSGALLNVSPIRYYTFSKNDPTALVHGRFTFSYGNDEPVTDETLLRVAAYQSSFGTPDTWQDFGGEGSSNANSAPMGFILSTVDFAQLPETLALGTGSLGNLPPFIYVNYATGDDAHYDGTTETGAGVTGGVTAGPFKTLTHAVSVAAAHPLTRIYMAGGDYNAESCTLTVPLAINLTPSSVSPVLTPAHNFSVVIASNVYLADPLPDSNTINATAVTLSDNTNRISDAMSLVIEGGSVTLPAAVFTEDVVVSKGMTIKGAKFGVQGADAGRDYSTFTGETVIKRATAGSVDGNVITVTVDDVTLDGLILDGTNTARCFANGTDADAWPATTDNLTIQNCVIQNAIQQGIMLDGPGVVIGKNNLVTKNLIRNISGVPETYAEFFGTTATYSGRGVLLRHNQYADVVNNTIEKLYNGVYVRDFTIGLPSSAKSSISNNHISPTGPLNASLSFSSNYSVNPYGVLANELSGTASFKVNNNKIRNFSNAADTSNTFVTSSTGSSLLTGFGAFNVSESTHLEYNDNTVDGAPGKWINGTLTPEGVGGIGYILFNCSNSSDPVTVTGGYIGSAGVSPALSGAGMGFGIRIFNAYVATSGPNSATTGAPTTQTPLSAGASFYNISNVNFKNTNYGIYSNDQSTGNMTVNISGCSFYNGNAEMRQNDYAGIINAKFSCPDAIRNTYMTIQGCTFNGINGRTVYMYEPYSTSILNNTFTNCGNSGILNSGSPEAANVSNASPIYIRSTYLNMTGINITGNIISGGTNTACGLIAIDGASSTTCPNAGPYYLAGTANAAPTVAPPITIYSNNFSSNTNTTVITLKNTSTAASIDASGNYWGATDLATVTTRASGGSSTVVDFSGWLDDATEAPANIAVTGFQGWFRKLYIVHASTVIANHLYPSGISNTFNEGLNMLNENGTLVLTGPSTGVFPTATINKNVTVIDGTSIAAGSPDITTLTLNGASKVMKLGSSLVASSLALTNGYLYTDTGSFSFTVPYTGITGGSANSYVMGPLSLTAAVTAPTLTFPIGTVVTGGSPDPHQTPASYRPFVFAAQHSGATSNTYTAELIDATAVGPVLAGASASPFRYFTLTRGTGGSALTSGTPTLSYNTTGASDDQVTDPTNLRVISASNATPTFTQISIGTGSFTITGVAAGSFSVGDLVTVSSVTAPVPQSGGIDITGQTFTITSIVGTTLTLSGTTTGTASGTGTLAGGYTLRGGIGNASNSGTITATTPFTAFADGATVRLAIANTTTPVIGGNFGATFNGLYVDYANGHDRDPLFPAFDGSSAAFALKTIDSAIVVTVPGGTINLVGGADFPTANITKTLKFVGTGGAIISNATLSADLDNTSSGVSFSTSTLSPTGKIEDAVNFTTDGGTITFDGGTFSDVITVTKDLTLNNTGLSATLTNLTMNGSGKTLTLGSDLTINALTLTNGAVNFGSHSLSLGNLTATGGELESSGGSLEITGGGNLTSPIPFNASAKTLLNLTVNRSAGIVKLGSDVNVTGLMMLSNGTLDLNTFALGLSGTCSTGTGAALRVSSTSSLSITGAGPFGTLGFDQSSTPDHTLGNFTLARTGTGTFTLGSNLTVETSMDVTGKFIIGANTLTLNGTFNDNSGTGFLTGSSTSRLTLGGTGDMTLPMDASTAGTTNRLAALTVARGSGSDLTLGTDLYISSSGTLSLNTTNLLLNGKLLTLNGAIVQTNSAKVISSTGSDLTLGGSGTAGTITFGTGSAAEYTLDALTLNKAADNNAVAFGTSVVVGDLLLTKGILDVGAGHSLTMNGNFNNSATSTGFTAINPGNGTFTVTGVAVGTFAVNDRVTISAVANPVPYFGGVPITGQTFTVASIGAPSGGLVTLTLAGTVTSAAVPSSFSSLNKGTGSFNITGVADAASYAPGDNIFLYSLSAPIPAGTATGQFFPVTAVAGTTLTVTGTVTSTAPAFSTLSLGNGTAAGSSFVVTMPAATTVAAGSVINIASATNAPTSGGLTIVGQSFTVASVSGISATLNGTLIPTVTAGTYTSVGLSVIGGTTFTLNGVSGGTMATVGANAQVYLNSAPAGSVPVSGGQPITGQAFTVVSNTAGVMTLTGTVTGSAGSTGFTSILTGASTFDVTGVSGSFTNGDIVTITSVATPPTGVTAGSNFVVSAYNSGTGVLTLTGTTTGTASGAGTLSKTGGAGTGVQSNTTGGTITALNSGAGTIYKLLPSGTGTIARATSGGTLRGSVTTDLVLNGTSISGLAFDQTTPGSTNAVRDFTMASSAVFSMGGNMYVADDFTVPGGSVFNLNGKALTLAGPLHVSGDLSPGSATATSVVSNADALAIAAAAADVVAKTSSLTINYDADFALNPYAPPGIPGGSNPATAWGSRFGTLRVDIGAHTLTPSGDLTFGGAVSTAGTGLQLVSGTLDLTGINAIIDGPVNYSSGGIKGSSTTKVTTNSGANGTVFTLSGSTGDKTLQELIMTAGSGNIVTLGGDVIANTLTLNSGILGIGSNTLTVGAMPLGTGGTIRGSSTSNLNLSSVATDYVLPMDNTTPGTTNRLNNLTLSDGGSSIDLGTNNDLVVSGTLSLTGELRLSSSNLTVAGILSPSDNYRIVGSANAGMSFTGTGPYTLPLSITTPGTTNVLKNLTVTAPLVSLSEDLTLVAGGTVNLGTTTGRLNINGKTLNVYSDFFTGKRGLVGSATSVLNIGGTGSLTGTFGFDQAAGTDNNKLASLTFDRTLTGTATLGSYVYVDGPVTTTNGLLTVGANGDLVNDSVYVEISPAGSVVESNSNSSRILGTVKTIRDYSTSGSDIPSGMGLTVRTDVDPLGANTVIKRVTTTGTRPSDPDFVTPGKSILRYYDIFPGTPAATGDRHAHVFLTFMDAERNGFIDAKLTKLYRAPINSDGTYIERSGELDNTPDWTRYTGAVVSANTFYNFYPIADFSQITLGGGDLDNPLPVTFLTFTAARQSRNVVLNWSTGSEQGASYFDVQRSTDGSNFVTVGKVKASGNSSRMSSYGFVDKAESVEGTVYYRIREVDTDGAYMFSAIRTVDLNGKTELLQAFYPNPARTELHVVVDAGTTVSMHVYDATGKLVLEYSLDEQSNLQPLDVSSLKPGFYNVMITNSTERVFRKLTIE